MSVSDGETGTISKKSPSRQASSQKKNVLGEWGGEGVEGGRKLCFDLYLLDDCCFPFLLRQARLRCY